MTVAWVGNHELECHWFDNEDKLQSAVFRVPQLDVVESDEK